jgi:hypothetical protein
MSDTKYNGWTNRQTWNVALWISNDEGLYRLSLECKNYEEFRTQLKEMGGAIAYQTPDGVAWNDSALDTDELDDMIKEARGEEEEDNE